MKSLRQGFIFVPLLAAMWMLVITISLSIILAFFTGDPYKPYPLSALALGFLSGSVFVHIKNKIISFIFIIFPIITLAWNDFGSIGLISPVKQNTSVAIVNGILAALFIFALSKTILDIPRSSLSRYEFEACIIRFLIGFGYIFLRP